MFLWCEIFWFWRSGVDKVVLVLEFGVVGDDFVEFFEEGWF